MARACEAIGLRFEQNDLPHSKRSGVSIVIGLSDRIKAPVSRRRTTSTV
ncbi:hypothetical protein SAMN05444166_4630 [Singulisphaera sp. GP187]|nr:hypothetical protein SAMN05444166_4630 [Singulisphaera sp. GP187]